MGLREEIASKYSVNQENISRAKSEIEKLFRKICTDCAKKLHEELKEKIMDDLKSYKYQTTASGKRVFEGYFDYSAPSVRSYQGYSLDDDILNLFNYRPECFASYKDMKYIRIGKDFFRFYPIIGKWEPGLFKTKVSCRDSYWGKIFFNEFDSLCKKDGINCTCYAQCAGEICSRGETIAVKSSNKEGESGEYFLQVFYSFICD